MNCSLCSGPMAVWLGIDVHGNLGEIWSCEYPDCGSVYVILNGPAE